MLNKLAGSTEHMHVCQSRVSCAHAFRINVKERMKENDRERKGEKMVDEGLDKWALGSPLRDVVAKKEQVTTALGCTATFVACFTGSGAGQT